MIPSPSPSKVKYWVKSERHIRRCWLRKASNLSLLMIRPKCCMTLSAIRNLQRICHRALKHLIPPLLPLQLTLLQTLHYWWVARQWTFKHFTDSNSWQGRFCLVPPAGWKQMGGVTEENVGQYWTISNTCLIICQSACDQEFFVKEPAEQLQIWVNTYKPIDSFCWRV